jgi:hypothetical protein
VDSLDASHFSPADGGGHVTALATVSESAQLRGADGEAGESYKTSYQVWVGGGGRRHVLHLLHCPCCGMLSCLNRVR